MSKHNLWIDDIREPPNKEDWVWLRSVNTAKEYILGNHESIDIISLDHDAGNYAMFGGDYIKILDWLEEIVSTWPKPDIPFTFHIHSMNPVGRVKMQDIILKNGWKYTYQPVITNSFEQCHKCKFQGDRCLPPMGGECKHFKSDGWHPKKDPPDGGFYG